MGAVCARSRAGDSIPAGRGGVSGWGSDLVARLRTACSVDDLIRSKVFVSPHFGVHSCIP